MSRQCQTVIAAVLVILCAAAAPAGPPTVVRVVGPPRPTTKPAGDAAKADQPIAMSFNGVTIVQIAKFLSEKKGKPVLPDESVKAKKVTVVCPKKVPLSEGLMILSAALRQSGVMIEETEQIIFLRPIAEAKRSRLPVVGPEQSVSTIADKSQIVDKVFQIKYYDVQRLKDVIVPLLPTYAHVTADSGTRQLFITDTAGNLERIERLIGKLDVSTADKTIKKVFKIEKGDASEILSILRPLIEGSMGKRPGTVTSSDGPPAMSMESMRGGPDRGGSRPKRPSGKSGSGGAASVVVIEGGKEPVMLMAEIARNWIIAVAPPNVMAQIEEWITRLDVDPEKEKDFDMLLVEHAEIDEAAQQIMETIDSMPGEEFKRSIRVVPFRQARKLIVFGSERGRGLVKELLAKIDDPESGTKITREFILKFEDAEKVAEKIESLLSGRYLSYESYWGSKQYRYDRSSARMQVVPDSRRNSVTVISDTKTIEKVAKLIEEWDKPIAEGEVEPRVYTLKYQDPQELKKLLDDMFTPSRRVEGSWFDQRIVENTPVGRLAGQFSFQVLTNSSMLIVTTKNVANYAVIDKLVEELDQPQRAGLPVIVELKFANAEDLSEQLNALLSLPGTMAEIMRSERGFTQGFEKKRLTGSSGGAPTPPRPSQPGGTSPNRIGFWWQKEPDRPDKTPASNMVGKIRFVPVVRRNALMVLTPEAYREPVQELVETLDRPSMQVGVHGYIAEVQHDDVTTLGLRVASDPSILNDPRLFDSAVSANLNDRYERIFTGRVGTNTLTGNVNVNVLLQLLMKKFGLKVLFEPTLYTKDNQEAVFFDGQDVPVQANVKESQEGTSQTRSFEYTEVGTRLRVRPHITRDGLVDIKINLEISRIAPGQSTLGNFIFDRRETTTHVVVESGQWIMISGIIRQEDFKEVRKVPLLGDIPGIGKIFRSIDTSQVNRELVAFIRPIVIQNPGETPEDMEDRRRMLEGMRDDLNKATSKLPPVPAAPAVTTQPAAGGGGTGKEGHR